ncbi:LLM class flavin-dependent oxidoreductase [Luedemannella helvata]|uniref:Luciferase-like domain-containing protein n=1 Tax=Luedemannella helvata TaxID=349315 RepID=A0ABN2KWD0_9ACTN
MTDTASRLTLGLHLPLFDLGYGSPTLTGDDLSGLLEVAEQLGVQELAASDHVAFRVPWLDGLAALAFAAARLPGRRLVTAACLPTVRGPAVTAKALAAISRLAGSPLIAGVAAGSSLRDLDLAEVPAHQRWERFEDALGLLRASLCDPAPGTYDGKYYRLDDPLTPGPAPGSELWVASWGSPAGVRRAVEFGDGLLFSAYMADSDSMARAVRLARQARAERAGQAPTDPFGFAASTCFQHVTDSAAEADHLIDDVLSNFLQVAPADLRRRTLVGSPEHCAERLMAFARAGVQRLYVLPVGRPDEQLARLQDTVFPLVAASGLEVGW